MELIPVLMLRHGAIASIRKAVFGLRLQGQAAHLVPAQGRRFAFRCVVLANSFLTKSVCGNWNEFRSATGRPFLLGAQWQIDKQLGCECFAIMTTAASDPIREFSDAQPVLVPQEYVAQFVSASADSRWLQQPSPLKDILRVSREDLDGHVSKLAYQSSPEFDPNYSDARLSQTVLLQRSRESFAYDALASRARKR
jgi:hypothetical protein